MERISWNIGDFSIPFWIGHDCLECISRDISSLDPDKVFIISEPNVWRLHGDSFLISLRQRLSAEVLLFSGMERDKILHIIEELAAKTIKAGASRKSVIVAMGGGLVGNVGGMLAGLLFRGIRLVHVPTTLLAMHDSVTSLKQAVNCNGIKNIVGLYHVPSAIYIDTLFLNSLPEKHIWSGIVELVKNAMIIGDDYWHELASCIGQNFEALDKHYTRLVMLGIQGKYSFMNDDPYERRQAVVFEYGHTVGHAIEISSNGSLTHGESVSLGMWCSGCISHYMGFMSDFALEKHNKMLGVIKSLNEPKTLRPISGILDLILFDNKRGYRETTPDSVDMILLREPGRVVIDQLNGYPLTRTPLHSVRHALEKLVHLVT